MPVPVKPAIQDGNRSGKVLEVTFPVCELIRHLEQNIAAPQLPRQIYKCNRLLSTIIRRRRLLQFAYGMQETARLRNLLARKVQVVA